MQRAFDHHVINKFTLQYTQPDELLDDAIFWFANGQFE